MESGPRRNGQAISAYHADVLRLQALGPASDVELHLLAFGQAAEPIGLNRAEVAEDVVTPAILGDEAVPLRIIEPLHGTSCHFSLFLLLFRRGASSRPVSSTVETR